MTVEEKNKSFGFWLNNKRDDFHITRNELSHESGVSEWDIELIENTPTSFDEGVYERLYLPGCNFTKSVISLVQIIRIRTDH